MWAYGLCGSIQFIEIVLKNKPYASCTWASGDSKGSKVNSNPLVHNRPQQAGFKHSRGLGLSNTQCASIGSLLPFTTQKATPPNGATLEKDSTQAGLPSQTAVLTHWQVAGNTVDASGPSLFFIG